MEFVPCDEVLAELLDDLHGKQAPREHSASDTFSSSQIEADPLLSLLVPAADVLPSPAHLCTDKLHIPAPPLVQPKCYKKHAEAGDLFNKKGQRKHPRIAFVVKSNEEELCDGYKWRKYGQKAMKKNSYPRKYYRCANNTCDVKKRTERSTNNPDILVVTYQGQHNHHDHILVNGAEIAWLIQSS